MLQFFFQGMLIKLYCKLVCPGMTYCLRMFISYIVGGGDNACFKQELEACSTRST